MALLTVQLLFVERDDGVVRLDVIVLARADAPSSPAVGAPLCFEFGLPRDEAWRDVIELRLRRWAEHSRAVDLDLHHRWGRTTVRIAAPDDSVTLEPVGR